MDKPSVRWRLAALKDTLGYALKLIVKNISPLVGSAFLFIGGHRVNKDGYAKRILVLFGGGAGDVIKRSIVCGYLHHYLPDREIYHLMPYDFELPYAEETIHFDYKRAKIDPRYYFRLVNRLRGIGFAEVVVLLPAWEGFLASLGKDVRPMRVFRYTEVPPKELLGSLSLMTKWLHPPSAIYKDIPLISAYDDRWRASHWPSDVARMADFISRVIHVIDPRISFMPYPAARTEVVIDSREEKEYLEAIHARYGGIDLAKCVLIGLGSSSLTKNWPAEKYAEVARHLSGRGYRIIILDHPKDRALVDRFAAGYGDDFLDLGREANLRQISILIKHAALVLVNDTSFVHLAVALGTPSVCPCRNHQIGSDSCYGYEGMNKWVFGDAIEGIPVKEVENAVDEALIAGRNRRGEMAKGFAKSFFKDTIAS